MKAFLNDLKILPKLILGLFIISVGLIFARRCELGMNAWGVFHQGISEATYLSFGLVVQLIGLFILILTTVFKVAKPGIGTILNMALIGAFFDLIDIHVNYIPNTRMMQYIFLIIGIFLLTFGRALYISCGLGQGPRDGLFVGLHLLLNIEIKYIKPAIEFTVLIVGVLLGGQFGVGTVIAALVSGYLVGMFLSILKYSPKSHKQRTILDYFKGGSNR